MKDVTCFINSLAGGGAEHQLIILANLLCERGFRVTFLTYNDSDDGQYTLNPKIAYKSIVTKGGRVRKLWEISKFLYKHQTDCFISYRAPVNSILLLPMLFRRNVKVIVGERNFTWGNPTLVERLNFALLYRRADYIVPNSISQMNYIVAKKPQFKDKTITIRNYTELDKYEPKESPNGEKMIFSIFCRYAEQKNYSNFAKAVCLLRDKGYKKCLFNWYGKIKNDEGNTNIHYIRFLDLIKELGLEEMIELHDLVIDVPEKMKKADVICLPSLYEGFSNSLSEAICCAKPVVASNVSDNALMVKDGVNGYLFNPMSVEEMSDALIKMYNTTVDTRKKMASASRVIAEELFNKDEFVRAYEKLIES